MKMLTAAAAALALLMAAPASAATIVDTGPGPAQQSGRGFAQSQWAGGRITLDHAWTIDSIKGWLGDEYTPEPGDEAPAMGSTFTIRLSTGGTIPDVSLYSVAVDVGGDGAMHTLGWYGAENLSWTVGPGDYWITFEVGPGQAFSGYIPWNAANPLDAYARSSGLDWAPFSNQPGGMGIQVFGSTGVPEPQTWAMLIVGFGLSGAALRRRRQVNSPFANSLR